MVQRDQNRVVLGAVAAAGFMFALYIIGKKLTRRKAGKGESSQQQPQGSIEVDKSSKILLEAVPLTPDSQTMSAPATASAAQPTAVESESTSSSSSQAPRTREGSMFYDSYGGYQRTHTADTMSLSKQGDRKPVMSETMSDFKSPRVSWYSGNLPPRSTAINTTSQAETSVSVAETQPRVSSTVKGAASGEPPAKIKPMMYYDHYGGNFMTHTSYTLSFSNQKDKKFVVSESMSELKGPRVAWHTEDNQPIIVPVSRETESLEKVVSSHEEVLKAEESAEYKEVVYSMAKGMADDVAASTLTKPPELEKGEEKAEKSDKAENTEHQN